MENSLIPNAGKCLVLVSGGQDSATCLLWAVEKLGEENVIAISFDYGQKHKVELTFARDICDDLNVRMVVLGVEGLLSGSSLTDHSIDVNAPHEMNADLPSSFTAGRNALFLTIAASVGYNLGIHDIVTGTCQTDFSGYPDCRRVFIDAQQTALSLALGTDVRIHTPLMYLTKAETWRLAKCIGDRMAIDAVEIIRTQTLTDYNGDLTQNDWGRGKLDNPASILREKGYREAVEKGWV